VFTLMARPGRFGVVTNIGSVRQSQCDDSAIKTLNPSPEFPWALLLGARCFPEGEGFDLFSFQRWGSLNAVTHENLGSSTT
jgi:hypothetical protein